MMIHRLLFTVILVLSFSVMGIAQEKIKYFDESWQETTRENASFYRPEPQKVDSGYIVKDYYINTMQLQGVGFSRTGSDTDFNGEVVWYHPNGNISQKAVLTEGTFNGPISNYDPNGKLIASGVFADGNPYDGSFFNDYGNYHLVSQVKQGIPVQIVMTSALDDSKARVEGFHDENGGFRLIQYYDQKGQLIGSGTQFNEYNTLIEGIDVGYAYFPMSVSYVGRLKQGLYDGPVVHYYSTGEVKKKEYYEVVSIEEGEQTKVAESYFDKYGKRIDSLTYRYSIPYEGVYYSFFSSDSITVNDQVESITTYHDGELNGLSREFDNKGHLKRKAEYLNGTIVGEEVVYDAKGNVRYLLLYKDGSPWKGKKEEYQTVYEYVDGEIVAETERYTTGQTKKITRTTPKGRETLYYSQSGDVLGQLLVDEDYNYSGTEYEFDEDLVSEIRVYQNSTVIENKIFVQGELLAHKVANGVSSFVDVADNKKYTCEYRHNEPWTGTVLEYSYANEYVSSKASYLEGKRHGECIEYTYNYETESVDKCLEQHYDNGKLDGIVKTFSNGILLKTETYRNNELDGETVFYNNQEVIAKAIYREGYPWEGKVVEYDYYNEIASVSNYSNGVLEGEKITYQSGNTFQREFYKAGEIYSMSTICPFPNNQDLEMIYKEGLPFSGKSYMLNVYEEFAEGNLKLSLTYDGDDSGTVILRKECNGSQCKEKSYYASGNIKQERQLDNEVIEGSEISYSGSGKIIAKGIYKAGIPVSGSFAFFNTYADAEYILMTIEEKKVSIMKYDESGPVSQYSATLLSKTQTMQEMIRDFLAMISSQNYYYDLPDMY